MIIQRFGDREEAGRADARSDGQRLLKNIAQKMTLIELLQNDRQSSRISAEMKPSLPPNSLELQEVLIGRRARRPPAIRPSRTFSFSSAPGNRAGADRTYRERRRRAVQERTLTREGHRGGAIRLTSRHPDQVHENEGAAALARASERRRNPEGHCRRVGEQSRLEGPGRG